MLKFFPKIKKSGSPQDAGTQVDHLVGLTRHVEQLLLVQHLHHLDDVLGGGPVALAALDAGVAKVCRLTWVMWPALCPVRSR